MKFEATKEQIEGIKKYIIWGYGKRCPDYDENCRVCQEWKFFDDYLFMLKSKHGKRNAKRNRS